VLRTYSRAAVYTFPDLEAVGSWDLPAQQQGEGIAVTPEGEVLVSSEGTDAPVLSVAVPRRIERAMVAATEPASPTPSTPATPTTPRPDAPAQDAAEPPERHAWNWVVGGVVGLLALGVLWRSLRPH
jgi:hypothetical protein